MKRNSMLLYAATLLLLSVALWGCPKKAEVTASPSAQKSGEETSASTSNHEAQAQGTAASHQETQSGTAEHASFAPASLKPVYFDFDKSFIRDDARSIMTDNAVWLKENPKVKIRIEGNCDERGAKEYNQALGQRRAVSAKNFLTDAGIAASRISLISYGKEKQVCGEHSDECWQKNRKDDFVITND